jgi:hypothetical protein
VDTALEIHRINSSIPEINDSYGTSSDAPVSGSLFNYIVDALLILLDNAAKYCNADIPQVSLSLRSHSTYETISISNPVSQDCDVSELQLRLLDLSRQANGDYEGGIVRKEGGSGYTKLGRLTRINLATASPRVDVSIDTAKSPPVFTVELQLELNSTPGAN